MLYIITVRVGRVSLKGMLMGLRIFRIYQSVSEKVIFMNYFSLFSISHNALRDSIDL